MITHNGARRRTEIAPQTPPPEPVDATTPIVVPGRLLVTGLALIAAGLLLLDLLVQTVDTLRGPGWFLWPHLVRFFDLNGESSLPTWFSVTLLSASALLTALIAMSEHQRGARHRRHWALLALLVVGFSIDEGAKIHDSSTGTPLRDVIGTSGLLYYAWVLPALASAVIVALLLGRFVLALPTRTRSLFLLAAVIFLAGAVGVEMLSGWYADGHPEADLTYETLTSFEEFIEMAGVILFIAGLLDYAGRRLRHTTFIWQAKDGKA